jgi:hypothetical protein
VVAEHHARSANEDLAVGCDLELDIWHRQPDSAEAVLRLSVRRGPGRQLGHAPALQDLDAQAPEELLNLFAQGRAATDEEAQPAAGQPAPDAGQDQPVGEGPLQLGHAA